jgi:outer membrane protein OmpA-like peptidoglycan-associated protein
VRAKAVRDYLIANGIDASRISAAGFGHSRPLYPYPERSNDEMIANRRVEIKILHK